MAGRRIFGRLQHNVDLPAALLLPPEPAVPRTSLYPPVVASMTAKSKASRRRRIEGHYSRVHAQTDIVSKLQLITGQQRLKYVVYPQSFALNSDRWYQHFTKTAYRPGLPETGRGPEEGEELDRIRSLLCDLLLHHYYYTRRGRSILYKGHLTSSAPFITDLTSLLSTHCNHPTHGELDVNPQVNFYWLRGETRVPQGRRKGRIDPVRFQIDDSPLVQLRVAKPLPENPETSVQHWMKDAKFVPLDHVVPEEVPFIPYEPSRLPLFTRQYENNIFIGAKVNSPCSFGHTQVHLVPDRFQRNRMERLNLADQIEVFLRANAIASLFAWTGAQAMYQGFWSQADVTRPFVSQAVISDGKYFSFFCYQLNTIALAVDSDKDPNRKNICWGTQSAPLYEAVEDGDIKGFNEDVFRQLVVFFQNRPE